MQSNFENYILTKIYTNDTNKDGKPYVDTRGKKFWRISLQVDSEQYKDKWISGMTYEEDDEVFTWKAGDQHLLEIYPKGDFINFKRPNQVDFLQMQLSGLHKMIRDVEDRVDKLEGLTPKTAFDEEDVNAWKELLPENPPQGNGNPSFGDPMPF